MYSGLTYTADFGIIPHALSRALAEVKEGEISSFGRDKVLAQRWGIGTVQVEALGAWMRLGGLLADDKNAKVKKLSAFGEVLFRYDPYLQASPTWWALHINLAQNYAAWQLLVILRYSAYTIAELDKILQEMFPDLSIRTLRNARQSVLRTLADTPLGNEIGIFKLEKIGGNEQSLSKLPIRYGQVPLGVVGYAVVDWMQRRGFRSVSLETLSAPEGVGPILHMSAGVLERYLLDLENTFRGRVLSYSRTASLNEVYLAPAITPLPLLVSQYIHEQAGLPWFEALERAMQEVPADVDRGGQMELDSDSAR